MTAPATKPTVLWVLRIRDAHVGPLTEFQARSLAGDLKAAGLPAVIRPLRLTPVDQVPRVLSSLRSLRVKRSQR